MNVENEFQTKRTYMSKIDLTAAWIQLSFIQGKKLVFMVVEKYK